MEEVLIFIASLRKSPTPANLMFRCHQTLPSVTQQALASLACGPPKLDMI